MRPVWLDDYSIGYAIFLVLSSTSGWGLISFAAQSQLPFTGAGGIEAMRSMGYVCALALFGVGCLLKRDVFRTDTKSVSAICFISGFVLLSLWTLGLIPVRSFGLMAGVLVGIGAALSFIVWQRVFANQETELAGQRIVGGSALSALLYLLFAFINDFRVYLAMLIFCIAANWFFQRKCIGSLFVQDTEGIDGTIGASRSFRILLSTTWRYMFCIVAIGFVSGVARIMAQQVAASGLVVSVSLAAGMLIASLALLFFWRGMEKALSFRMVYTVLFFLVSICFFFVPFAPDAYRVVFAGIANGAFAVASILMTITCIRVASLRRIDSIAVFGIFAAIVYGGVFLGRLIGESLGGAYSVFQVMIVVFMSVYALSFAGVLINYRKASAKRKPFEIELDEFDDSGLPPLSPVPAPGDEGRTAESDGQQEPNTRWNSDQGCCRKLKSTFGLTNRETDVLELVIKGRDVSHMAETLFVSENTVRTHWKNLYRKLGVHNRQQLFDLIEELRSGEGDGADGYPQA